CIPDWSACSATVRQDDQPDRENQDGSVSLQTWQVIFMILHRCGQHLPNSWAFQTIVRDQAAIVPYSALERHDPVCRTQSAQDSRLLAADQAQPFYDRELTIKNLLLAYPGYKPGKHGPI